MNANGRLARWLAVVALLAVLIAGCVQLREIFMPSAPGVTDEWAALLDEIRTFERRIGFRETDNFFDLSHEQEAFPFCGYASRFYLPYSYEDPAIRWLESVTEQECRELAHYADAYFGAVEALGESGTPVTPAMITGKLDRFLYLVMHEDCHDQFDLPYGIEEALCNLIAYKAMAVFSEEKFGSYARDNRAIRRYADAQSRLTRATISYYEQLATLYARHERAEISSDVLLRERTAIFKKAERALAWTRGELNNVGIASDMTYSRHYPFLESVFEALGRDLARTVAFFRHVDQIKPSGAAVMKRHHIATEKSLEFIRAYEAAVAETIKKALAESRAGGTDHARLSTLR
ncbi:MAG: hypothetical protein A3F74_26285 [Betaproteobacteria bacterium RIFCSPLOWO2_12_FULL_62_58]|nr:MAG: hypothetical protein A3F74_26285 [Betaproteobacteria bacterium RIFCSPLOWO2_12_FULL_62_58]